MDVLNRRLALALPALLLARTGRAAPALERTARILVGAAPGGATDLLARLLAEQIAGLYAPAVVVENKPGASSRIAAEAARMAVPDGTTLLLNPSPVLTLFPHSMPRTTRFRPADFTPVTTLGEMSYGLVVRSEHPAQNLAGLIDWAKARGEVDFAPPVLGAPQHLLGMVFAAAAGLRFNVIAYRTAAQSMLDLLAGQVPVSMSHMAEISGPLRAGRLRLLAVTSAARLANLPEVPTFAEAGFPQVTGGEAYLISLPAAAPAAVVASLHAAVAAAAERPALRERQAQMQLAALTLSPAATAARLREEFDHWGRLVAQTGFRAEE